MKIYAPNTTERVKYAIDLVLKQVCLFDYEYVSKEEIKTRDIVLNYSGEHIESSFQVHPHGLLFENDVKKFDVTFKYGGKEKIKLFKYLGYSLGNQIILNDFQNERQADNAIFTFSTNYFDEILKSRNFLINKISNFGLISLNKNNLIKNKIIKSATGK